MCQIIQKMLIFSLFLTSFLFLETGGFTPFEKRNMYALRRANNHFAVAFHKSISDNFGMNFVFSPFSIFSSLSMLYFSTQGETAKKMLIFSLFLTSFLFLETGGFTSFKEKNLYALRHANNHFAVAFHKSISKNFGGSFVFSPFSIFSSLSMLYVSTQGETAKELREVLGYGKFDDWTLMFDYIYYSLRVFGKFDPKIYTVSSISAMVVDKSFPMVQQHKKDIEYIFDSYVQEDDVKGKSAAVVDRINTWSKFRSRGAIGDLADAIDPETKLYLASAANFKGAWNVKFDPDDTKYHPFYNGGQRTNTSEVPMMHAYTAFRYFQRNTFTAVELFYADLDMSMVIYLPNNYDGLEALEESLTAETMTSVRRQMLYKKVHLTLPKFRLKIRRNLVKPLKDLGVKKIFQGAESDLSRMIATLTLDQVEHKALIEVDEGGRKSPVIKESLKSASYRKPHPEFKVDHPFLFAVFDTQYDIILFMGRCTNFWK